MEAQLQEQEIDQRPPVTVLSLATDLRDKRKAYADAKTAYDIKRQAFDDAHAEELEQLAILRGEVSQIENDIRVVATASYKLNPDAGKKICPGVSIAVSTVKTFDYDQKTALSWGVEKQLCLTLDTKAFEALCETSNCPDFVTVTTEDVPTVRIDKDLDKACVEIAYQALAEKS